MVELKEEGLYIANGKDISVLVKVVGKAPMLDIVCGVLLNEMQANNTVKVLDKNSPEIQDILLHPDTYVFDYPVLSEAVNNSLGLNKPHSKQIEYTEKQFSKWVEKYQKLKKDYPEECNVKMTVALVSNDKFSVDQAEMIIKQINSRIRIRNYEK